MSTNCKAGSQPVVTGWSGHQPHKPVESPPDNTFYWLTRVLMAASASLREEQSTEQYVLDSLSGCAVWRSRVQNPARLGRCPLLLRREM